MRARVFVCAAHTPLVAAARVADLAGTANESAIHPDEIKLCRGKAKGKQTVYTSIRCDCTRRR